LYSNFDGAGYLLTASVAAVGGYAVATFRYAPRLAALAQRVEVAETSLFGQGREIHELSRALRSLLSELEGNGSGRAGTNAILAARDALSRR
jgi:hypothetical protein